MGRPGGEEKLRVSGIRGLRRLNVEGSRILPAAVIEAREYLPRVVPQDVCLVEPGPRKGRRGGVLEC